MSRYGWGLAQVRKCPLSAISPLMRAARFNLGEDEEPQDTSASTGDISRFFCSIGMKR